MVSDLEQIDDAEETRLSCKGRGDIGQADRLDGVHLDVALIHGIAAADLDVWTRPDSDTARNFAATNPLAKTRGKHHAGSLYQGGNARSAHAGRADREIGYVR